MEDFVVWCCVKVYIDDVYFVGDWLVNFLEKVLKIFWVVLIKCFNCVYLCFWCDIVNFIVVMFGFDNFCDMCFVVVIIFVRRGIIDSWIFVGNW